VPRKWPQSRLVHDGGGELGEDALNPRVAQGGERLAGRAPGGEGGEALLGGLAAIVQVQPEHGSDSGALMSVEVAAGGEMLGRGPGLVARPVLEGGDELDLIDDAVLEGERPKEEVAIGEGGHGAGPRKGRRARWTLGPRHREAGAAARRIDWIIAE
jgi:hypothetical protein